MADLINIESSNGGNRQYAWNMQHWKTVDCRTFVTGIVLNKFSIIIFAIFIAGIGDVVCKPADNEFGRFTDDSIMKINITQELITQIAEQHQQQRTSGAFGDKTVPLLDGYEETGKTTKQAGKIKPDHVVKAAVDSKEPCHTMEPAALRQILGSAYNPRYMSIEKPSWIKSEVKKSDNTEMEDGKMWQSDQEWSDGRSQQKLKSFHVQGTYSRILHDEPVASVAKDASAQTENIHKFMDVSKDGAESITESEVTESAKLGSPTLSNHHRRRHHPHRHGHKNRNAQLSVHNKTGIDKSELRNPTKLEANIYNRKSKDTENYFKVNIFEQVEPQEIAGSPFHQQESTSAADKFIRVVRKRRTVKAGFPWSCESRIEWIDLGHNHFPRFLRSVVCTSDHCWFGHFQCRPKAFTVKILRRRKDSCHSNIEKKMVDLSKGLTSSVEEPHPPFQGEDMLNSRVPQELREQWVFEERAVTFCCECAV